MDTTLTPEPSWRAGRRSTSWTSASGSRDIVLEGLALVPLGAAALLAAGWISEGLAAMSRALINYTLVTR